MHETMTRIELSGVLGKTFGKVHYRLIKNIKEAGEALSATIPGFEKFMISSEDRGLTYAVFKGKKNIGHDDFGFPVSGEIIRIVPVIIGSKKAGVLQTILGAVIVAASVAYGFFTEDWANAAYGIQTGGAMMFGGVVQMLSPQPAGLARKESSDNKASYAFGGVTNTASQGYPVPLLYGKRRIGGAIISAGIYVEDQQ
ncbi:tail assembly protein (plasmid) [Klebsiella aerogenes]|uniref:tail assembly protein n=1 Tax=Klebsiella pneumoniae TaxID=573 RepID=UPI0027F58A9F|nr:tail assembly protein [Klebsiella pneumoniae]EKW0455503.1 tail assembly protein [Klebsiella pneumoniae]EKZ6303672.1 tail assembly protein [Klebsiella pneumoniae]ELB4096319.1 tail assembly protein [Klebsiella pneumoniae]ELB5502000.1 tail assembly protein [Klebsiella oxytoca]